MSNLRIIKKRRKMEKTKPQRKRRLAKDGGAGGDSSTIERKMSTIKGKKSVLFEILTPVYAINDSISVMGSKIFNAL